jgi:hypothetical protein
MATKEELENFYRENRIRQAQSVAPTVYDDPANAPTFFGSSLPIGQVERNLQVYGGRLEPYEPTMRENIRTGISDAGQYLGLPQRTSQRLAKGFMGNPSAENFSQQIGLLDLAPVVNIPFYLQEAKRGFDRAQTGSDYIGPALEGGFALLEGALVTKPIAKTLKPFATSLAKKLQGETSNVATKQEVGALPKVIANTKLKAPSMAMKDPKVVDEFGFYSEAERQAKMMQQNKGSGAQFAGFLLNKGVKQDELDAIGLTDLFKNDNVTKKEIIDTIELNKVQLIETKKTAKAFTDPNDPYLDDFDPETFTNIRNGEEGFKTADEVKEAHETGRYSQPTIEYDAKIRIYANSDETESMKLYGSINTHMPTQYKILELGNLSDEGQDITDIYLTFRPNADVKDWRNSVEASTYADEQGFDVKDLDLDDFAEIIQDGTAQTFAEATVRLRGATIAYGDYDPGIMAKWEGSTQDGGTNYKELLLRLPPKGNNRFGKNDDLANPKLYTKGKDFQYTTHFDEFNPLFHIRTKDRVTNDGKKVLYVEELQSDWGQRGAGRGFKLEGDKLAAAKKELADARQELTDLKKGGVKLDGYEQETLYKLAYPNRPPIRIPFIEPKDFRAKHDNPSKYYDTEANVKDYEFDFSQSRMPEEFKTMTFGQYMNFIETMAQFRRGEISDKSLQYRKDTILDPQAAINKYYDGKDADFLFGQLNQSSFNADGNKFMKDLSNNYLKKYNAIQGGVPSAPFVTDRNKWTGLAIKRLIKLADEGGYDHVAFTPGAVQLDRWGKQSLVDYYDKIIPQVASKLPKSLGVTTEKITIPIKPKVDVGVAVTYDGRYFVRNDGSDKAIEGKFFKNEGDAFDYADMIRDSRTNQETFAINITPKMKETLRGGMPLFSTVGGMVGLGALGSMPSTQDGGT